MTPVCLGGLEQKKSDFNHLFENWVTQNSHMGVSKNNGTPKSSILIGFSIINHPFWDTLIFGNTHINKNDLWTRKTVRCFQSFRW